jgi:hypothetical protein
MSTIAVGRTATCTKFRHPSEGHAIRTMHEIWGQRRGPRRLPTRAYLCPRCGYWHLTAQPRRDYGSHLTHMTDKEAR